ncbi:ATP-binding protein [Hathewaya histolytica]|uniref:histidine kinase n=1 Tax=Hathewaya histolytica TaxID=1498 RepID=A0A4U9R2G3_HATHI|nr:ATP-binding protein [Hathewaya histolytica]VTQ84531.1 PAS domain-containing protein [Hathewaya histolytica]
MFRSLKSKLNAIYLTLVLTLLIVSINAFLRLYNLNQSIENLMVDNYKSISASSNMKESIEEENLAILNFIYYENDKALEDINLHNKTFYKWFNIESNNITEITEKEKIDLIGSLYSQFENEVSNIENIKVKNGTKSSMKHYEKNLIPIYKKLKKELLGLSSINEKAMFNSKNNVLTSGEKSLYFTLFLSLITVMGGLIISKLLLNKYFRPIALLTENVKSIREGNLNQRINIISQDEIGILTKEFNNMTERLEMYEKSTTGELMKEKNRSITLVKSIPDPLILLDSKFRVLLINKACENFFNLNEMESLNKSILNIIKNSDLYNHISDVIANKNKENQKIIPIKKGDKIYFFNTIVTAAENKRDIIVVLQNVTQLKKLEEIKNNFISTVSHEFKTPLNSIILGTSLLIEEDMGELNTTQKEILETIMEDGEKLSSLVINLLQLTKIESDKAIFNYSLCSIEGIIDDCYKNFYELAEKKSVNLCYEMSENIPKIEIDSQKINWVINNLLSNALKFTNPGDEICIKAFKCSDKIFITVSDTGIGIPEKYVDKIFDKFVQIHDSSFELKSTGLGLAIAKEIVQAHGGNIWCESTLDMGSTFTFTLPLDE